MISQDLRFALRGLRKAPAFSAVAILSLTIGIGANSAIFSLISQLILKPLPVRDPQSIVMLLGQGEHYGGNYGRHTLSYQMYQDLRDRNTVFDGMMCRTSFAMTVGSTNATEIVGGEAVSGNYFPVLGVGAALGHVFTASDDLHPGGHPYAVLSYSYWQSRFGGNPGVLGQTIRVNNYPLTIVGVAQRGFTGMEPGLPAQIFAPITMMEQLRPGFPAMFNRRMRWVNAYGRLKPGMSMEHAQAGLQPVFHGILESEVRQPAFGNAAASVKEQFLRMWMQAVPGGQGEMSLRQKYEKPLLVLMGIVALVLLMACANLASLLTARAAARRKEIAIRLAVGSSRTRIVLQLLTESLLLAVIGGIAGIGLSILMVRILPGFLPVSNTGYNISSTPDIQVLLFSFALTALVATGFGLIPALQATKPDLAETLKDQGGEVGGRFQIGFRKLLVAFQVTVSLVLLIGAGMFLRSLSNLETQDPGFRTEGVLEFSVAVRNAGYNAERIQVFFARLHERLRGIPGVRSTASADQPVLSNYRRDQGVTIEGRPFSTREAPDPHFNTVSSRYFETLGMHLLSGRDFDARDTATSTIVAIVNEKFAKRWFVGVPAVGRHIGLGNNPDTKTDIPIIGVVNDARYESMRDEIPEEVYLCQTQQPLASATIYVFTEGNPENFMAPVRRAVRELDPNLPVSNLKTFSRQLADSLVTERLTATLATIFGVMATGMVLIGLYGVMSFMVTRRSREIGIRMALGAFRSDVVWMVMREALVLIAIGLAVGLPAAYALTKLVQTQLYGIEPGDPASIAMATVLLAAVTALAAFIPARRAASFDPWRILRHE